MTSETGQPGNQSDFDVSPANGRRSFVKGILAMSAGLAAAPALAHAEPDQTGAASPAPPTTLWATPGADVGTIAPSSGLGRYFRVFYPASQTPGELQIAVNYTMWLPDDVHTVRGVIVHQHGAGMEAAHYGSYSAYDLHWQALAKKWDCGLMGPSYRVINDAVDLTPGGAELWFDPRHGSDKTFLKALGEIADQSGHPEIASVPWCLWGHSGGGIWANLMSILYPSRVAAMFLRSGSAASFRGRAEYAEPKVPDAVYAIPALSNAGVLEKRNGSWGRFTTTFEEYRAHGAPFGWAPDPRTAHFCGDSRYLAISFFDACLGMRLPEKDASAHELRTVDHSQAWLAPYPGDAAVPAKEFKGDEKKSIWLPNEKVARAWMEYVRTGTVSDASLPPAPFGVRVNDKGEQGTEISWEAEADIASGLGGFVVIRDGIGIARLPEQPPEEIFGRPLFQGLSFHDTPTAPLPKMSYLDAATKGGTNHVYTVTALSSAGVPSNPGASAAAMRSLTGHSMKPLRRNAIRSSGLTA
jgi:hypothetical protein